MLRSAQRSSNSNRTFSWGEPIRFVPIPSRVEVIVK
jgi:hypothetical protein